MAEEAARTGRISLPESGVLASATPKYTPIDRTPVCVSLAELLAKDIPVREPLLSPWLTEQSLSMLYAWRGIGKSWVALSIAYAVATGSAFLGWQAPRKRRVLYLDGELPARVLQSRLALIVASFDAEPDPDGFRILTPDLQPNGVMPNLSNYAGQEAIDVHATKADLIVVDNLSTLARSGKENEGESWLPIQEWALRHRAQGRAVLFVHHGGKNGQQRGASRREDVLDTSIKLVRPDDYNPQDGAVFELHFEKARNLTGDEAMPLDVRLVDLDGKAIRWDWRAAEAGIVERIKALLTDGAGRPEIQQELGVSRFQLTRIVEKANAAGENIKLPDGRIKGAKT
ncbi:AAA family ATPase [Betaproteobacteria bacterium SCN2]|nr:AAA family ATPase [Betaproteobacteria bacterium SCN2]